MSKTCPACRAPNREHAKHCISCGASFPSREAAMRLCPAGRHAMDTAWEVCPYCAVDEAGGAGGASAGPDVQPTVIESPPRPAAPVKTSGPQRAEGGAGDAPVAQQHTVFMGSGGAADAAGPGVRRIVGILITYTWTQEGQIFPLREGRTVIGRDASCDVAIPQDSLLSGRHASVIVRERRFWIDDENSMNGTQVDGHAVVDKHELASTAALRVGATDLLFLAVPTAVQEQPFG